MESSSRTPLKIKKTSKQVLIVCSHFWPSIGGVENRMEQFSAALVMAGYEVTVMTLDFPGRASTVHNGVKILSIDPAKDIDGIPAWPFAIRSSLLSGDYDSCILVQDPLGNIIWSVEGATPPAHTRLIIQPVINADGYGKWKDHETFGTRLAGILKGADATVAMTKTGPENQFMHLRGMNPVYIPNASSVPEPAGDFRARYNIPAHRFLILHVANLYWVKNHIGLLESLHGMPESWLLVMVGNPSGEPDCAKKVMETLAERPDVVYIPGLSREWVAAAMKASDVIVLSSFGEGSPNTILEAMANGKPWLATPQCGAANDNAGGIVCNLGDFKKYLALLKNNSNLRQTLGGLGQQHWQSCLSWHKVVAGWIDLIETGSLHETFEMPSEINDAMSRIKKLISDAPSQGAGPAPLVSVIVPTFNRPEKLQVALESILSQNFTDFEIVVVSDAGSEVSAILAALPHQGKIVYLRHQVNRGPAAARNTGINAARGRYIAYLDDDDIFYPDHLETLVQLLQTGQHQVAYTDAFCARQRSEQGRYCTLDKKIVYSFDFDYQRILVENFIPILCIMHEKSCLLKSGLFDDSLKRHEDWDLWIRMSRHFRFEHLPKATCEFTFRPDGSSITTGTLPTFLVSMHHVFQKYAQEVAGDHLLRQRQKHALMQLNLRIFSFLGGRIESFGSLAALPFRELQQTGATQAQIRSVYHYLQAKKADNPQETVFHLKNAIAECPENHQASLDLVSRYREAGAYALAASALTLLEEADPGEKAFAELRVLLQEKLGPNGSVPALAPSGKPCSDGERHQVEPFPENGEDALVAYLGILQRNPDDTEAMLNIGKICACNGQTEDARLLYDRILALVPGHPQALGELDQLSPGKATRPGIEVSVVIPVFNQANYTRGCLEALFAVTGEEIPYEVIVVDNASSDWTPEYLKSLKPRIRLLTNDRNLGFAKACNQGARAARGRYLIFLNNDTVAHPGWLPALVAGAQEDGADIVGGRLLYPDGTAQHAGVSFIEPGHGVHVFKGLPGDHPAVNSKRFMQCVTGACLLIEGGLFRELGGFDEGYINGYEDVDLCLRAREAGKRILYAPTCTLTHFEETSAGRKDKDQHNADYFFRRWRGKVCCDNTQWYEDFGFLSPIAEAHADQRYAELGTGDSAGFIYLTVLERHPGDTGALLNLGRLCTSRGQTDNARICYQRILSLTPGNSRALQELERLF